MALPVTIDVPLVQDVLYTVPRFKTAVVDVLHVVNANGSSRTFTMYLRPKDGNAMPISAVDQALASKGIAVYAEKLILTSGCTLEAVASGSDVTCVITGSEQ